MKAFLLDIDGTTLLGPDAIPGAAAFVAWLRAEGVPFLWVTNNTSLAGTPRNIQPSGGVTTRSPPGSSIRASIPASCVLHNSKP